MSQPSSPLVLSHPHLGECRLERVEGMNWLVRDGKDRLLRVPVSRRGEFVVVRGQSENTQRAPTQRPASARGSASHVLADKVRLKRMFETIRTGLPPADGDLRHLAVGIESFEGEVHPFLDKVAMCGAARIIRGAYGQGKSFSLRLLQAEALTRNFLVARTEIDASENQLNKPHHVYRDLIRNLRIPEFPMQGASGLAALLQPHLFDRRYEDTPAAQTRRWLEQQIECAPLAWLLSDHRIAEKPELLGLFAGDPNVRVQDARKAHILPGTPRDWPNFTAGTQGDFACYVLSGLGRLARLLGFKGLILVIDEMEKWQDLNWRAQAQAGNLIGGLIWAATGEQGKRHRALYRRPNPSQPEALAHSLRSGGYPFTTETLCNVGLVIAMTPRGEEGPEELWRQYGPLPIFDLPAFTPTAIRTYISRVVVNFQDAYDLPPPDIHGIERAAISQWAVQGDGSARTAVQSVVSVLDSWRAAHSTTI